MFIRKKKYEDLLERIKKLDAERTYLTRENIHLKAPKKCHDASALCIGCKHLITVDRVIGKDYHCKLDRGCKEYTEE